MAQAKLNAFLKRLKSDQLLQGRLLQALDFEAVSAIAMDAGIEISVEELQRLKAEISESEIESVKGGACSISQCLSVINHL